MPYTYYRHLKDKVFENAYWNENSTHCVFVIEHGKGHRPLWHLVGATYWKWKGGWTTVIFFKDQFHLKMDVPRANSPREQCTLLTTKFDGAVIENSWAVSIERSILSIVLILLCWCIFSWQYRPCNFWPSYSTRYFLSRDCHTTKLSTTRLKCSKNVASSESMRLGGSGGLLKELLTSCVRGFECMVVRHEWPYLHIIHVRGYRVFSQMFLFMCHLREAKVLVLTFLCSCFCAKCWLTEM